MAGESVKAIYGLYGDPDAAQRAVERLRSAGIVERAITIVSSEPIEEYEFAQRDKATWIYYIASGGGLVGLGFGTWLAMMTQTAWPLSTGNMPIVSWWPNAILMFEFTMLGGILATVVTLFITAIVPSPDRKLYDPSVADGQILVGVENPTDEAVSTVERALRVDADAQVRRL